MKVRGSSDFTVETTLSPAQIIEVLRGELDAVRVDMADKVLEAELDYDNGTDLGFTIVLGTSSFAEAEELIDQLRDRLQRSLVSLDQSLSSHDGSTLLVPA